MGIAKRAGDLVYTLRFLRLLTTDFVDTKAYALGIIDEKGNRNKDVDIVNSTQRDAYTPFHRLVWNIKKLIAKAPGGDTKIASYASALYLMKEKFSVSASRIQEGVEALSESIDMEHSNAWFVLEDNRLSPGNYKVINEKVLNGTCEEVVKAKDWVRIPEGCYPVGNIFGINIYEAIHIKTNQKVYVSISELLI
jgi:hypothetical protein